MVARMTERTISAEERGVDALARHWADYEPGTLDEQRNAAMEATVYELQRLAREVVRLSAWVSGDVARARKLAELIVGDEVDWTRLHPEAQRAHRFAAEIVALLTPPESE